MKLINVEIARTVWLFPLSELNPDGRSMTEALVDFAERYHFKKAPKHALDFDTEKALSFEEGEFKNREGRAISVKFRIYNDGIIADSWSSTGDSDDFLEDVMQWLKSKHGFSLPPDRKPTIIHLSQLTVSTDRKIVSLNPKLRDFENLLSQKVGAKQDASGYGVAAIAFWPNDHNKPNASGPFRFENKAGTSLNDKRYFAQAPVSTDVHLELLEKFEAILA